MAAEASGPDLAKIVALLGAAVVAVPIFKRLGLGSVLGYLAAGLAIGPFGLALFTDPQAIIHVAELGVVMFLFIVGLEMEPARLWGLRREIFGLGALQVGLCSALLTIVGLAMGFPLGVSFIAAAGFVLTSTAIVMQVLEERGEMSTPKGQRMVSILLLEDLGIVPLLALVAFLAPGGAETTLTDRLMAIGVGIASIVSLIAVGRYLLNPLFSLLANAKAREILTAAALLVVLGSALALQLGGLSMAMGAFLAGVLLSGSSFRHQLEADIEPFRGLLLGLFFLGVGMALDLRVVAAEARLVLLLVPAMMLAKGLCIYAVARLLRSPHAEALDRAVLMAQGGEFAFVLFAAAAGTGLVDARTSATLTAVVVLSMVLTPLVQVAVGRFLPARARPSMDGIDVPRGLDGSVLIIGFGRFGQVMSQALLARDVDVTIIDTDVDMIRSAAEFGFKVYYGDGTRLDVLHASGAGRARAVAVCVDDRDAATRIATLVRESFPQARVLVRAYDREHARQLVEAGVDFQVRETFAAAVEFGEAALRAVGVPENEAAAIAEEVRRLDAERFALELASGSLEGGKRMLRTNVPQPTPLRPPQRRGQRLDGAAEADGAGPPAA